ncbi:MAG: sugar ABC transporter ATP-binding protein [Spirochaetales bacterium]|uniref:Sugar ABC transporter ATP-binding protein n=1 Tax=Candidatus Thalassospirochaeta sargassi TaxID=3119039 RepID=A0AAJ1IFV2_9SPIO|nr:sugar ABC transporter ATP-binding protein [Spirochaetales bacterium]
MSVNTIKMEGISKSFFSTQALKNVDFECRSGEVHALVGLNGAGKSTLINVLGGVHIKDEGNITLNGESVNITNPIEAREHGISIIHQEYSLINELSISRNIFLGREIHKGNSPFLDYKEMDRQVNELLEKFDLCLSPNMLVNELNSGQKQFIEIIRSLMTDAWLIVMDEPTSALSEKDKEKLFEFIERLRNENIGIIYISHHMPEIFGVADEVTVMRDGQRIETFAIKDTTEAAVVKSMIGEDLKDFIKPEKHHIGDEILKVKDLNLGEQVRDVNFSIRKGEILVLTGLRGSGIEETAKAIYGLEPEASGEITYKGEALPLKKGPRFKLNKRIGFVSANRDKDGILHPQSVKDNISLPTIKKLSRFGYIDLAREIKLSEQGIKETTLKTESYNTQIKFLSGGNKQKAVFARWLDNDVDFLMLLEPTRGVDVHAKAEIYRVIEELSEKGLTVMIVSYEIDEVLMCADRVLVMFDGKNVLECGQGEIEKEKILAGIAGVGVDNERPEGCEA